MIKQALKDSLIYGLAAIIYRILSILQVPLFVNLLTPTDFGLVDITEITVNLLNLTVALEVSQAVAIYFSESSDRTTKKNIASTSFLFTIFSYLFFFVVVWNWLDPLDQFLFDSHKGTFLIESLLIYAIANGIFLLTQNLLRWMLKAKLFFWVALAHGIINLLSSFILVKYYALGAIGIIYGQIIACLIGSILSIYFAKEYYHLKLDLAVLKKLTLFSFPLVFSSISVFASLFVDRFCIKELIGLDAVGIYGIAYRFASTIGVVIVGFSRAFTPLIYNHADKEETPAQIAEACNLYLCISSLIILFLAFFSLEILTLLADTTYLTAANLIPLIAISLSLGNMYIFAPGFAIKKKTTSIAVISIACAFLNFVLNLAFIPYFGMNGAAYATIVSSLLAAILWVSLSQKYYYVPFSLTKLIYFTAIFSTCMLLAFSMPEYSLSVRAVLYVISSLVCYLPFRSLFDSMSKSIANKID